MPPNGCHLDQRSVTTIQRLLSAHWRPDAIAEKIHCSLEAVYRIERNILTWGTARRPRRRRLGRPRSITTIAWRSFLDYLAAHQYLQAQEMVQYLWEEWAISVDESTIRKRLKNEKISRKIAERIGPQSLQLRAAWQADMANFTADQLVFIDESSFNKTTGWRRHAWAAIGQPARYHEDPSRGESWSVLPGYLPCTGIRRGYFNAEAFFQWVTMELLPHLQPYPHPRSVVCLDNASIHLDPRVKEALERHGCLIKFLPPYSPDYSPIELTFSVLKSWVRRNFRSIWQTEMNGNGDFGDFLQRGITESHCDQHAIEHFRHSADGYIFEGDLEAFERELATL